MTGSIPPPADAAPTAGDPGRRRGEGRGVRPPMFAHPPSLEDLAAIARTAIANLPPDFRRHVDPLAIRFEEFPSEEVERDMKLDSPFDLMGLYDGVPLTVRSVSDPGEGHPTVIVLYRRPILDYWCESGEDLIHLVRHVIVHEIGHHFGLSDADMTAIEAAAAADDDT